MGSGEDFRDVAAFMTAGGGGGISVMCGFKAFSHRANGDFGSRGRA